MTTYLPGEGVQFRVWAPKRKRVQVIIESQSLELEKDAGGYFSGISRSARPGSLYKFKLDSDDYLYPDPESRFQPEGPHGPSQVVDPNSFQWSDRAWKGIGPKGQLIYEMHIGTFTREGTFQAAQARLNDLANTGITVLELMPLAEFTGHWGWGYDGVDLFAPTHLYGTPDDAKRFIDEAHRLGLGVILDVVYNHFGPDGNYIKQFADEYFTDRYENEWGEAINFSSAPVRDFYLSNGAYWIEEFHFDGLRLDATQDINDDSPEHIIAAISKRIRAAAGDRKVYLVAENEPQYAWMTRSVARGGYGIDALWNDDFHHSAMVRLTGRKEAYYTDYFGSPQEFVSAAKYGYLYQGQRYKWQKKRRGTPALDLQPWNFVSYVQNHDQIANSARGDRVNVLTDAALYRAMSALLILGPATPMLFQGQEFGATTPFFYFCDHPPELCALVDKGRREFLAQFRSIAQPEMQEALPHAGDPALFKASKLDWDERDKNPRIHLLYKDLIQLRREDPVLSAVQARTFDGAVLSPSAFLLRYFNAEHGDRLLLLNFGVDLHLDPAPEPLLAPPPNSRWSVKWSSEHSRYGGSGTFPPDPDQEEKEGANWRIAGHSALLLVPVQDQEIQK